MRLRSPKTARRRVFTYDFDATLTLPPKAGQAQSSEPNRLLFAVLRQQAFEGHRIVIVTGRKAANESQPWIDANYPGGTCVVDFVERHRLPIADVIYVGHQEKGRVLLSLDSQLHFDDDAVALADARRHGIQTVAVRS